jgi:flagellar motility protein MotE (MotC chaperone)
MTAKLLSPVSVSALSLLLSVGLGVALSWRALSDVIVAGAAAAAANPAPEVTELKQKGWDFWTIEIENLSNELKEERERLKKQAEQLDLRAARVASEEKEFAKLRADVEAMRKQIADKVYEIAADEAKNIRTLAQTYTTLTPRAAVAILKEMDDATAVKILSVMKPDVVGPIFEEMSRNAGTDTVLAKRAATLSEKLRLMKAAKATSSS